MKTILAYGDSLTWGTDARANGRHAYADRWPTRLEAGLGGKARVVAEGLPGRTTAFDDHLAAADRNGARILPTLLDSHAPLDLVVIMLGTNDLKPAVCGSALEAAYGIRRLIQIIRRQFSEPGMTCPKLLIVSPPHIVDSDNAEVEAHFGRQGAKLQAREFAARYRAIAEQYGTGFFDAATVATADPVDGIHLDAANTRAIGDALVAPVSSLLGL